MVVGGELDRDVLEVGRALRTQVDDDVEDRAPRARARAWSRRPADTGSASRAACPWLVERDVGLGDDRLQPVLANSCWQNVRAKNPRLSSRRSMSMMKAPLSFVSVNTMFTFEVGVDRASAAAASRVASISELAP